MRFPSAAAVFLGAALALSSVVLPGPESAQAAPVVVPAFPCAVVLGGNTTVPAGSTVIVRQRWDAKNHGLSQAFLNAQTTLVSVNGGTAVDVSQTYDPISTGPTGNSVTRVSYDTGITLGLGQQLTFVVTISFSHRIHDGFSLEDNETHRPLFFGPGATFTFPCTVTGV